MNSWKKMLDEFDDEIIESTLSKEEMEKNFDDGFGCSEGKPFTAWSKEWVYFPVAYDGAESVGRAPRNPCEIATDHIVSRYST